MLTIYGKSNCNYCTKAKALADQYHIKYVYKDVAQFEFLEQMVTMAPKTKTVPQIWWNGRHIGGYNEFVDEVQNTLGNYGQEAF